MKLLAIECTHQMLSAALYCGDEVFERKAEQWQRAAESIVPLIEALCAEAAVPPAALGAVAVSSGPGSFTALRIGMSVAKGIAFARALPLIPVPTLPALAAAVHQECGAAAVLAVIESRRGEYYHALYQGDDLSAFRWHDRVARGGAGELVAALDGLAGPVAVASRSPQALAAAFSGTGAELLQADCFSARSLLPAAQRLLASGRAATAAGVVPEYCQPFVPKGGA